MFVCGDTREARSESVIIEIVKEANRILREQGWTQLSMARDAAGKCCSLNDPQAVSFSVWGSIVKAWRFIDPDNEDFYFPFFERKLREILASKWEYHRTVTRWNDEQGMTLDLAAALLDAVIASFPVSPDAADRRGAIVSERAESVALEAQDAARERHAARETALVLSDACANFAYASSAPFIP